MTHLVVNWGEDVPRMYVQIVREADGYGSEGLLHAAPDVFRFHVVIVINTTHL